MIDVAAQQGRDALMGWSPGEPAEMARVYGGPEEPEPVRVLVEQLQTAVKRWARYPSRRNFDRMAGKTDELAAMVRIYSPPPRRPFRPVVPTRR